MGMEKKTGVNCLSEKCENTQKITDERGEQDMKENIGIKCYRN